MEDFFQRHPWGHARAFKIVNCCNGNCDSPRIKYILFGQQIPRCNPKSLTKLCMTNIDAALSCHNALDCLIFADAINSTKLCRQARSFIIANKSHDAMHRYPLTTLTRGKNHYVATNFLVANFQYFELLAVRGSKNNKNCPSSFSNFSQKCC